MKRKRSRILSKARYVKSKKRQVLKYHVEIFAKGIRGHILGSIFFTKHGVCLLYSAICTNLASLIIMVVH